MATAIAGSDEYSDVQKNDDASIDGDGDGEGDGY